MTKLSAKSITATLGNHTVLKETDFDANSGEVVGLIGPNGVGKTTLLRVLCGLITPDHGTVMLNGIELADIARSDRARRIAYLPADAPVHWPLRVDRLVGLGRIPHAGLWQNIGNTDADMIQTAMTQTDVLPLAHRVISSLSSGERSRVLIARALAVEPEILLADEPVSSLDPYHQLQIMELLRSIAADGRTVVAVLHDLTLAARFCDRIALIADGRVSHDGRPQDVLTPDIVRSVYGVETVTASTSAGDFIVPWRRVGTESQSDETVAE